MQTFSDYIYENLQKKKKKKSREFHSLPYFTEIFSHFVFYSVFVGTGSFEKPWAPGLILALADHGLQASPTVQVSLTDLLCLSTSRWNEVQASPLNPIKQWRWQVSPPLDLELGFFPSHLSDWSIITQNRETRTFSDWEPAHVPRPATYGALSLESLLARWAAVAGCPHE